MKGFDEFAKDRGVVLSELLNGVQSSAIIKIAEQYRDDMIKVYVNNNYIIKPPKNSWSLIRKKDDFYEEVIRFIHKETALAYKQSDIFGDTELVFNPEI